MTWVSAKSENEGCRAEKIVDDYCHDSSSGRYHDSYSRLTGSNSWPTSKESVPLLRNVFSKLLFHYMRYFYIVCAAEVCLKKIKDPIQANVARAKIASILRSSKPPKDNLTKKRELDSKAYR